MRFVSKSLFKKLQFRSYAHNVPYGFLYDTQKGRKTILRFTGVHKESAITSNQMDRFEA